VDHVSMEGAHFDYGLYLIDSALRGFGKSLATFKLPPYTVD